VSSALTIRDGRSFGAGVLFGGIGLAAFLYGHKYPLGDPGQMGPGFFPAMLSLALVVLGSINVVRSLSVQGEGFGHVALRPLLLVSAGVVVFALGVDRIGLVASILLLVAIGCLAGPRPRLREVALLAVLLAVLSAGIFVYALKLPFTLF
jgi:Tripartite tricarboxylate transporter TctB family